MATKPGQRKGEVRSPEVMKAQEYSAVVETPRRRAGITNKPQVLPPNETHREPSGKKKDVPVRGRNRGEGSTVLD